MSASSDLCLAIADSDAKPQRKRPAGDAVAMRATLRTPAGDAGKISR